MSTQKLDYSRVFNRLCHLAAITKQGKVESCIDNLVLTLYAIDNSFAPVTIQQIADAIYDYYGLPLQPSEIQASLDRQQSRGAIHRHPSNQAYVAFPHVRAAIEKRILEASQLEEHVRDQWISSLQPLVKEAPKDIEAKLWLCLRTYMGKAFQRHGVETIQLLKDSTTAGLAERRTLSSYLTEALSISSLATNLSQDRAIECIQIFFKLSTPERTKYIAQLLDGTFSFFALANEAATSEYLRHAISPVSLFLDTNFIFGILDLHTNPLVEISKELIGAIKANNLPFKIYFHEETLTEITRTINSIGQHLKSQRWQQSVSRVAVKMVQMSGLELKYHQLNSQTPTEAAVFLTKYEGIAELLKSQGFTIYRDSQSAHTEEIIDKAKTINEYQEFIERRRPKGPKPYEALNHDIVVWRAANSIRRKGMSVLDAGSLILTVDYFFYCFDWEHLRKPDDLGIVVLPNQFLQLLRPLIPSTIDFDLRFVETFALPEFRVVDADYAATCSKVLSYINTYADISEETATRILANSMLLNQLRGIDEHSEEFSQKVDSALARDNELLLEEKESLLKEKAAAELKARELEETSRKLREDLESRERDREQIVVSAREGQLKAEQVADNLRREMEKLREETRNHEEDALGMQQQIRDREHGTMRWRVSSAALFAIVGILIIMLVPALVSWNWLNNHPNRLGLYGCAVVVWLGLAWSIADRKHRGWSLGAVALGAVLVLFQILGR